VAALVGIILSLAIINITTAINCQLWVSLSVIFLSLSEIAASLLIVLRIIAIWNKNKVAVTLAITVWGIDVLSHVQSVALFRSNRAPTQLACVPVKTESSLLSFIPAIICDMILLLIMLVGLLILRRHHDGTVGLTHLLWKQGVVWLALGTVTEIPPLVLIALHLNCKISLTHLPMIANH